MEFLDTQILIDAFSGTPSYPVERRAISSIAANELLQIQGAKLSQAKYYVPMIPKGIRSLHHANITETMTAKRDHPFNKMRTDRVIMDFGGQYPTIIEYGNLAIAEVINEHAIRLFDQAINFLSKERQKILKRRFRFLLDMGIQCVPLDKDALVTAQELLYEFGAKHSLKDNFRNTWNDMLIVAAALQAAGNLTTRDTLLARFTANRFAASQHQAGPNITIEFERAAPRQRPKSLESKGYINRGWNFRFEQNR